MGLFDGKVAIITGAARGLGFDYATYFLQDGAYIVLGDINCAAVQEAAASLQAPERTLGVCLDVTDLASTQAMVEQALEKFGRVDILVNNAGAVRRGNFLETADAEWHEGFGLKFFAHVWLTRALWPMLKQNRGSVLFISGIGARAPAADYMIGAAVIGASLAFMKALSELGKRDGVQVLTVNPGSVETDRLRHRLGVIMERTGLDEAAAKEHHRRELDITRFGTPGDIGGLVAFAVSPHGRWLHGTAIDMDGGQVDPLRMSRYDARPG